jgi:Carbohydrate family 9 binding domain-like
VPITPTRRQPRGSSPSRWLVVLLLAVPLAVAAADPEYRTARAKAPRAELVAGKDAAWAGASTVAYGPAPYETRFRALWNDSGLLLRFDSDDPSPWHTMTRRDDHLWEQEVVEVFIDLDRSGRDYAELEISPGNVVCDVRMIEASPWNGDFGWNIEELETNVVLQKRNGKTTGWTALAFLPWSALRSLPSSKSIALPPKGGDRWRFNLFRVERPGGREAPKKEAIQAAWSVPPGGNFHTPGVFRDLVFEP